MAWLTAGTGANCSSAAVLLAPPQETSSYSMQPRLPRPVRGPLAEAARDRASRSRGRPASTSCARPGCRRPLPTARLVEIAEFGVHAHRLSTRQPSRGFVNDHLEVVSSFQGYSSHKSERHDTSRLLRQKGTTSFFSLRKSPEFYPCPVHANRR